jgi:tRNA(Ile)-lysidine synthase
VTPIAAEEFAAWMAPLGPFEPAPHLAAAVSGGGDSLALALLAAAWASARNGRLTALIVDHRLREGSAAEAALTAERLKHSGIAARILVLPDLSPGSALAERARSARYAALEAACVEAGIVHLLLGHHAADQAETVAMRMLAQSGPDGLAGMAALVETAQLRLLRPLLRVPRVRLRATLRAANVGWVEDPSNEDPQFLRTRIRQLRADPDGDGPATHAAVAAAVARGTARAGQEIGRAAELAARVRIYPEGYAVLSPGSIGAPALAALLRTLAGAPRPPSLRQVAGLADKPEPATLAGVRIMPAGRLGPGWLLVREAAAMAPPVPALPAANWDGRFSVRRASRLPMGLTLGPLGDEGLAMPGRQRLGLPAAVLRTLPAFRRGGSLVAVPHLRYPEPSDGIRASVVFRPSMPVSCAPFLI